MAMIRDLSRPFIMVDGEGTVQNISMFTNYEDANKITRAIYGETAVAVEYRYTVAAGDLYQDGVFYNVAADGSKAEAAYIPSEEDIVEQLQVDSSALTESVVDNDFRLTSLELGI